jgi:hypothetical protein
MSSFIAFALWLHILKSKHEKSANELRSYTGKANQTIVKNKFSGYK